MTRELVTSFAALVVAAAAAAQQGAPAQPPKAAEGPKPVIDIQEKIKEALGGIEFPRQRQDEVSQMLALEQRVAPLTASRKKKMVLASSWRAG